MKFPVEKAENQEFDLLDTDTYELEITKIESKPTRYDPTGENTLSWEFAIIDEGYQGRKVWGLTQAKFVPGWKGYEWVSISLGREPKPEEEEVDTEELIGKRVRGLVEIYVGSDGKKRNRVATLLASKGEGGGEIADEGQLSIVEHQLKDLGITTQEKKQAFYEEAGVPTEGKLNVKDVLALLQLVEKKKEEK